MFAELTITDGTTYINLLNRNHGFHVVNWRPALPGYKGGGVFQDSPLAHGRRLVTRSFENVVDTFDMAVSSVHQNAAIYDLQELARLLEKGVDYWAASWQNEPVWLEARAINETNKRYAIIHTWRIPELDDPYRGAFISQMMGMDNLTLIIEHGLWLSNAPGESTCVEISAVESYCWPPYVEFNGNTTSIVAADNAAIQDLHDAAMTVEAWIYPLSAGESNQGKIICKDANRTSGWWLRMSATGYLGAVKCAVADGTVATTYAASGTAFSEWIHIAMTWDDTWGNTFPRLWINGVEYSTTTQNRNGAVTSDVGDDLYIGNQQNGNLCFYGNIGWCRVSNIVRYNATFTPPPRCVLPAIDGNTRGQWIGAEESGATIDNQEGTAAIDGTLSNGSFDCDCEFQYGNVTGGCAPAFLEFNGDTSEVLVSDHASIQDLHDATMTAEAWIRADGLGEGNQGKIICKDTDRTVGWHLRMNANNSIYGLIECATADGISYSSNNSIAFGTWHHVAMTWDDTWGNTYPRLWIDGVADNFWTQNRNGAVVSDIGADLYIGNQQNGNLCFGGDIGWVRVSDTVRYSTTFTPPARCTLPAVDGNTVLLEIQEGVGVITYDQSGNDNDGAITAATWGCDCSSSVIVRDAECG